MSSDVSNTLNTLSENTSTKEDLSGVKNQVINAKITDLDAKVADTKKTEVIDADVNSSYNLIIGTTMESTLKRVLATGAVGEDLDAKVKAHAETIDKPVKTYWEKALLGFPKEAITGLCVGTEFAMIDILRAEISAGTDVTSLFGNFGGDKNDLTSASTAFTSFFKFFNGGLIKLGKANKFFTLAKRVENFKEFLVLNKTQISAKTYIPELMNPYKAKLLLTDSVKGKLWDDADKISAIKVSDVLTLSDTDATGVVLSVTEKTALQTIANSAYGNLSDAKVKTLLTNIESSCDKADRFLEVRGSWHDKTETLFKTVFGRLGNALDYNLPLFGSLGETIGVMWPADFLGSRKKKGNKVLDFVLSIFGFSGGVSGLHKAYVNEKYKEYMTADTFTKKAYGDYVDGKSTDKVIANTDVNSTWVKLSLDSDPTVADMTATEKTALQAVVPPQYDLLRDSISDNLISGVNLNYAVVTEISKLYPAVVPADAVIESVDATTAKKTYTIDGAKITDKVAFADAALAYLIPLGIKLGDDFASSENVKDADTFALGILGALIGGRYFTESVNLGLKTTADFVDVATVTSKVATKVPEKVVVPAVGTEVATKKEFITYVKGFITTGESAGKYDSVNAFDVNGVSLGLLQWHATKAQSLMEALQKTSPTEFATIMGDDFKDLTTATLWNTKWDTDKITRFQTLMKTEKFQTVMDTLAETDITAYIATATKLGITEPSAVAYYCYMQNAGVGMAKAVLNKLTTKDLASLHTEFLKSTYIKTYPTIGKKFETLYADLGVKDFTKLDETNLA